MHVYMYAHMRTYQILPVRPSRFLSFSFPFSALCNYPLFFTNVERPGSKCTFLFAGMKGKERERRGGGRGREGEREGERERERERNREREWVGRILVDRQSLVLTPVLTP